jgi:UDP-glucose:(galactosyl)LPS alpha-1,2-glucosyltransferase
MNILMTLDENYVPQGRLMLETLRRWNPEEISVYVMHTSLTEKGLEELAASGCRVISVAMTGEEFRGAPITDRYPPEMYYRLLAARYLPEDLERILYLDPDMIVLGSLRELYDLPMTEGIFYAAATHLKEFWRKINEKRLDLPQDGIYVNSGVLLMNLAALRKKQDEAEIFRYIRDHEKALWLPDQDIISALYGDHILEIDPYVYNMTDKLLMLRPEEEAWMNLAWVREHTRIVHFCGRNKPWKKNYKGLLGTFYQEALAASKKDSAL